jgi:hypothetical protein
MNSGASSILAKILGWAQFGISAVAQGTQASGLPHGAFGWLTLLGSLATAVALHHASSTDGSK